MALSQCNIDAAYCISLRGPAGNVRWTVISHAAEQADVALQRFSAVDCRENFEPYAAFVAPEALKRLRKVVRTGVREEHQELTPGAVGCYLSHLAVLRHAYKAGHRRILVFEDDAVIRADFAQKLKAELDAVQDKNWEMLMLGYEMHRDTFQVRKEPFPLQRFYCTHAYVITQRGMEKVLSLGLPLEQQFDSALSSWTGRLAIWAASHQICTQNRRFGTTIQVPVRAKKGGATNPEKRQTAKAAPTKAAETVKAVPVKAVPVKAAQTAKAAPTKATQNVKAVPVKKTEIGVGKESQSKPQAKTGTRANFHTAKELKESRGRGGSLVPKI